MRELDNIKRQLAWLYEQIKCLRDAECSSCQFQEPALSYDAETGILTVKFVDGTEKTTTIEAGVLNFILANCDTPDASNGSFVIQENASQISAYEEHLIFEYNALEGVTTLRLSDTFLSTINRTLYIEGTWLEFKELIDNNNLIPGQKYILTDYQTKYFIEGSNSSPIINYRTITSYVAGYAIIDNAFEYTLEIGMTVEITKLPDGYAGLITVGSTTTVTANSSEYYFQFANGMHAFIGFEFKYTLTRYTTIGPSIIASDTNGKLIIQPGGIVNTQAHNGTPYLLHTAAENPTPPIERIILTASSPNSFQKIAESDTFEGDYIEYDFHDTDILNDNLEVIGQRNGWILRRATFDGSIDLLVDWRVRRWRRWLIDTDSRQKVLNQQFSIANITAGSFVIGTVYQIVTTGTTDFTLIGAADNLPGTQFTATGVGSGTGTAFAPTRTKSAGGINLFTADNRNTGQLEQFYIISKPEEELMTSDFLGRKITFSSVISSLNMCKDFTIFPMDINFNPLTVEKCIVTNTFYNTIFRQLPGEFDFDINISINGSINNSTFISSVSIPDKSDITISNWIALDSVVSQQKISNLLIFNLQSLSHTVFQKVATTIIKDVIFGNTTSNLPGMASVYTWTNFTSLINVELNNVIIGTRSAFIFMSNFKASLSTIYCGESYTSSSTDALYNREEVRFSDSIFSNVNLRLMCRIDRAFFNDMKFPDSNGSNVYGLFLYDFTTLQERKSMSLNRYNYKIYRLDVDISDVLSVVVEASPL